MLLGSTEAVKLRSAESILDRTGHSRTIHSNDNNSDTIINLKREDLELLNDTLALEKDIVSMTKSKDIVCEVSPSKAPGGLEIEKGEA
jgi:hypothetical protein